MSQSEEDDYVHVATALSLSWVFGINKSNGVLNLSTDKRKALFYTAAHTGILYNIEENNQILYQGHCNTISCLAISEDKRWLATADIGKDCMLIVWDTHLNIPIQTLFDADDCGIMEIAFSKDAKFIASLSCKLPQRLAIWDWTTEGDIPVAYVDIDPTFELQTLLRFNGEDNFQLLTNNEVQVIFYKWDREGNILVDAPELHDEDFNKVIGGYTQSVFQPSSNHILTASNCGNVVVWHENSKDGTHKALKIIRLMERGINLLTVFDDYIVTADTGGSVKFFNFDLKLLNWFNHFGVNGSINSLSFSYSSKSDLKNQSDNIDNYPKTSDLDERPFIVSDFTISTTKSEFCFFKTCGKLVEYKRKEHYKNVCAIACHPTGPTIAIGGHDSLLQIIDFETKCLQHVHTFSNQSMITALAYSQNSNFLAVGFSDGRLKIVDSVTLELEKSDEGDATFLYSNDSILQMKFSIDSQYLAVADEDKCVVVYKYTKDNIWMFLGKYRSHYKPIVDILFTKSLDTNESVLLSLGQDRMLVEYDLVNSSKDNLKLKSQIRVEQSGLPLCLLEYPDIVKESFILIANNEYKMKLFNSVTKMCRHKYLGPTYGSPIERMQLLPKVKEREHRYLAYNTADKVGLSILPLDGNPYKSMALVAHPGKVYQLACSYDGKYIFTAGGPDLSCLMWKVNTDALEATAQLGGEGFIPFYSLIEGGRDGELFAQLEEFFYYSQIRNQGVDSMETRSVAGDVPLSEIPFILRALGFYPTEQEIEEMINEVKFSQYVVTGKYVNRIDLETLIKLYVNHRPAFGLKPNELLDAFEKLSTSGSNHSIERSHLLQLLQDKGEHLTETELANYVTLLLEHRHIQDQDNMEENTESDSESSNSSFHGIEHKFETLLPGEIDADHFANEILGFSSMSIKDN